MWRVLAGFFAEALASPLILSVFLTATFFYSPFELSGVAVHPMLPLPPQPFVSFC